MKELNIMYFSATGTTKKVLDKIGETLLEKEGIIKGDVIDFTLPKIREKGVNFSENQILLIGVPVYAGRVPNVLLKYLSTIKAEGTIAIPLVLYGNRHYDNALIELNDILTHNGFQVIAGAAFIGEHSFSTTLAKGRPDSEDLSIAVDFGNSVWEKLKSNSKEAPHIKGDKSYDKYYVPKDKEDKPVDIRKVIPKTDENCIDCKLCAEVCPMGSIDYDDVHKLNGICIKCGACVKKCPTGSKYFDDPEYLMHKRELEDEFKARKTPELFI